MTEWLGLEIRRLWVQGPRWDHFTVDLRTFNSLAMLVIVELVLGGPGEMLGKVKGGGRGCNSPACVLLIRL